MKTKFEDPNKKPEQIQPPRQLASEKRSSGLLPTHQMLDPHRMRSTAPLSSKSEKFDPNPHESAFLAMVQGQSLQQPEVSSQNLGTVSKTRTLKECTQENKSKFEIEFKDLGKAGVEVVQRGGEYVITINMQDKSKIPANPLLFRQLIEKQLGSQFGVNFKIRVS